MADKKPEELEEAFKRAAAIAATVPPALQEVAFNRALDAVLGVSHWRGSEGTNGSGGGGGGGRGTSRQTAARDNGAAPVEDAADPVKTLMSLPRDKAEEVDDEDGALGKALAMLVVAEREAGISGLSAPQIAAVLTGKFKWKVSRQAITQALDRAGKMVDSYSDGPGARLYRIMSAGETYLATSVTDRNAPVSSGTRRKRQAPASPENAAPGMGEVVTRAAPKRNAAKQSGTRRTGPKEAIEQLIATGFFASPQVLGSIRDEIRDRRGLVFKSTDLSPCMTRLLRDGKLTRRRNGDAQYEYLAADA